MAALIGCISGDASCKITPEDNFTHVIVCDAVPEELRDHSEARPVYLRYQRDGESYLVSVQPECERV